MDITQLTS